MGTGTDYTAVCDDEAGEWRKCVEVFLGQPALHSACESKRQTFDQCITTWRKVVGPSVQVKGENEGDPPFQCAAMSCLVGECLRKFSYDFDRCRPPMQFFKHCVAQYYGSEYIVE